ncbi:tRNA lysidine(34) synthetase TilS [Nocardioides sp. zg-1228]|uniref:tRNA lysidine(34) synthetase TilS n=1 Tax=Nocardioides sp. zg-1228 TaxID=2763008 RepID=UPI0016425C1A|nr:tRNA lysidine(34) synthetase TilS [Nocardioides sp. zg-1228]MBC2932594.1 tRNA lysidine(34) synthetase TilS [Nocardioides sp. zg-1228]QSF58088.1 tRNA lysidine(34) synthetase TilS [Nocardioides sp. zg-1228]
MTLHPSVAAVRLPVRATLARLGPLGATATVAVACSGGADSLALASATVFEARRSGARVVGVTVDHGLQPGSAAQADRVVAQLAAMGVDETLTARVTVDTASGLGPEAAAREARYAVLEQVAEHLGASLVLLGHTLDDQAETVLLGLARGSGGRSLQGMRPAFGVFARPLLGVRRADTVTACQVEGIEVWDDPHNDDPGYTRVRVRRRVLPVLEDELGPGIAETLARTADQLREDTALLDRLAEESLARARRDGGLDVAALGAEPPALRHRVVHRAALDAGCPPSELAREHVLAVDRLLVDWRGQKWIDLPGHVRALRRDGLLVLEAVALG